MGCVHSRHETLDTNTNIFHVVNTNNHGTELTSGKLEVTDTHLKLYRKNKTTIVWPLHSLRRYGFEGHIFSFESGRRCETGEGIYGFKCKQAHVLFARVQEKIQLQNSLTEGVSGLAPSPQGRATLQASVVHRSSIDNGQPGTTSNLSSNITNAGNSSAARNVSQSPRSQSSTDNLEVMPLGPGQETNANHVSNVYQLNDFKREHNNNHSDTTTDSRHLYCNDFNRQLAVLRNTQSTNWDEEDVINQLKVHEQNLATTMSPTLSGTSEHYAHLNEQQTLYMNTMPHERKFDSLPTTPLTPKSVEYCNLNLINNPELNMYANLALCDLSETVKSSRPALHFSALEHNKKLSESDTFTSLSPVDVLDVNYAVLDIDSNKENTRLLRDVTSPDTQSFSSKNASIASCSSVGRGRLVAQSSVDRPPSLSLPSASPTTSTFLNLGYTTIDFDKTVALTSVAAGDVATQGERRTRHNSINTHCSSPNGDRNKYML